MSSHVRLRFGVGFKFLGLASVLCILFVSGCGNYSGATPTPPIVSGLSQISGPVGISITVSGANFGLAEADATVTFNGVPATITSWSVTSIVVTVPANATTGNVVVTVSGVASNGVPFTVTPAAAARASVGAATESCGAGNESIFNGHYAFVMQGFDAGGAMALAGTISPDGAGAFTAVGLEDYDRSTGDSSSGPLGISTSGSSYSVGSDGRGCMTLATSDGKTAVFRISLGTFSGAGGSATSGHLIEADSTGTTGSGVIRQQAPAQFSLVSGSYAFGGSSAPTNFKSATSRYAAAGSMNITSGGVVTGSLDVNEGGVVNFGNGAAPLSFSGTDTIDVSTGRGTESIVIDNSRATLTAAIYVVSSTELLEIGTDSQSGTPGYWPYAVTLLQQSGVPFASGVGPAGSVMVLSDQQQTYANGGSSPLPLAEVGLMTVTGTNSISYSSDRWSGSALSSISAVGTASLTSAALGRVKLTVQGMANPLIAYLVTPNEGFIVGMDTSASTPTVESGFFQPQVGTSFSSASASGKYSFGTRFPMNANATDSSGVATFDGRNHAQQPLCSCGFRKPRYADRRSDERQHLFDHRQRSRDFSSRSIGAKSGQHDFLYDFADQGRCHEYDEHECRDRNRATVAWSN